MIRTVRLAAAAVALLLVSGCATKKDVRTLQEQILAMQLHQDSVLRAIQRQNTLLLDSVRTSIRMTVDARGTTAAQLTQFERNVSQLGQLVAQIMGTLNRIEQRITALEERPVMVAPGGSSGGADAEEMYRTGMQMIGQRSLAPARYAFEQILEDFPQHDRAPDAQFQLGEIAYLEEKWNDAYSAFERLVERWPQSARAAPALVRAGAIAEERRDVPRARGYYTRVTQQYRGTPEATHAQERLRRLPPR